MHDYVFDAELVSLAIALGVAASMLFYDRFGVTTGGMIIPGYLALFVTHPTHIAATLFIAIGTFWIVQRFLRPRLMLWGRRLYETEILVTLVFQIIWTIIILNIAPLYSPVTALYAIGFLLPGIMAHDMGRQGVRTTIWASGITALAVFGVIVLVGALRDIFGLNGLLVEPVIRSQSIAYAYPREMLLIAVTISVLASMWIYGRLHFFNRALLTDSLRTGGFVTAAYLALFITSPLDILFAVVCSIITYLLVTRLFMRWAILFGRTKVATMFLTALVVTWLAEAIILFSGLDFIPWQGFNIIVPTVVALLANDAQRQGPKRTVFGVGLTTIIVFVCLSALQFGASLLDFSFA